MPNDKFACSVARLLTDVGLTPEPEPSWLTTGPRPDFFCPGDPPTWVEAKLLERTPDWVTIRRLWDSLRERAKDVPVTGTAHSYMSPNADEGAVKRVLELVRSKLEASPGARCVVALHGHSTPLNIVEFSYTHDRENVRYIADQPFFGRFGIPFSVPPDSWDECVTIACPGDGRRSAPLFQEATEDAFLVALDIHPSADAFRVLSVTHAGGARLSTVQKRLRKALRKANRQFKSALEVVPGPTLTALGDTGQVPDTIDGDDILAALFGDLTVPFAIGDEEVPPPFYGQNGIWHSQQHTSTSAVCWVRDGRPVLTVHNPWADAPLPKGLLPGEELEVDDEDGRFRSCSGARAGYHD